jgi:two-component system nitrogen regulation response regulator NtrX
MRHTRPKIVVVDDEPAITTTLTTILERQGYETASAYSGEEAVQVAGSFQPDCVVSDVVMGAMNGIEAAIEILRVPPLCKVLLISGNVSYQDILRNTRAKGLDVEFLAKPIFPPDLLAKLSQIVPVEHGA